MVVFVITGILNMLWFLSGIQRESTGDRIRRSLTEKETVRPIRVDDDMFIDGSTSIISGSITFDTDAGLMVHDGSSWQPMTRVCNGDVLDPATINTITSNLNILYDLINKESDGRNIGRPWQSTYPERKSRERA